MRIKDVESKKNTVNAGETVPLSRLKLNMRRIIHMTIRMVIR